MKRNEEKYGIQGGHWGLNKYRPKTKITKYRPKYLLYRPIIDHKSFLKNAYFQKAVTLFDFVIVMENLYSTHNICRTLLLYLGQM